VIVFLLVVMRRRMATVAVRSFVMLFRWSRCCVLLHARLLEAGPGRLVLFEAGP